MIIVQKGIEEPWQFQFAGTDITGMKVVFMIKAKINDTDASAIYTDTFLAGTHADASAGLTASQVESAAHTKSVPAGSYYYEARLFDSGGDPIDTIGPTKMQYSETLIDQITG